MTRAILISSTILSLAIACGQRAPAEYGAKLAACEELARNCAEYVSCRKSVSEEFKRPFSGSCAKDAGAE